MEKDETVVSQLPVSVELLEFYRERLKEYEKEHNDAMKRVEKCEDTNREIHSLQWEVRKRMDEIADLQKALSDAQLYLYDERQHVLRLSALNDQLQLQELEDRKKMQQLLHLAQPVHQEVSYFKDRDPETMVRFLPTKPVKGANKFVKSTHSTNPPFGEMQNSSTYDYNNNFQNNNYNNNNFQPNTHSQPTQIYMSPHVKKNVRVLRTVYLPNEKTESLLLTIESLRAQLSEQIKLNTEQTARFIEERRNIQEQHEMRVKADASTISALSKQVNELHSTLCNQTRDYLALQGSSAVILRRAKEETELAKETARKSQEDIEKMRAYAKQTIKAAELAAIESNESIAKVFREQALKSENTLLETRARMGAEQKHYKGRIAKLSSRIASLEKHHSDLSSRRHYEKEGYNNEINILKKSLKHLENQVFTLKNPYHGLEMELLENALDESTRGAKISVDLQEIKRRVRALENDYNL